MNPLSQSLSYLSTDNFFFRAERAKILDEANKKKRDGESSATSFEDIGRIIGKRWREISDEEHSRYKEMAAEDSNRYQKEMKIYYKDELTLMCLGHNTSGVNVECTHYPANYSPQQVLDKESSRSNQLFARDSQTIVDASNVDVESVAPLNEDFEDRKPSAEASFSAKKYEGSFDTSQNSMGIEKSPGDGIIEPAHQSGLDPFQIQAYRNSNTPNSQWLMSVQLDPLPPTGDTNKVLNSQITAQRMLIAQLREELDRERRISRMKDELLHQYINSPMSDDLCKPTAACIGPTASMPSRPNISTSHFLSSEFLENSDRRNTRNDVLPPAATNTILQGILLQQLQQQQQKMHEQRHLSRHESTLKKLLILQRQQQCQRSIQNEEQQLQHQETLSTLASPAIIPSRSQDDAVGQVNRVIEILSARHKYLR